MQHRYLLFFFSSLRQVILTRLMPDIAHLRCCMCTKPVKPWVKPRRVGIRRSCTYPAAMAAPDPRTELTSDQVERYVDLLHESLFACADGASLDTARWGMIGSSRGATKAKGLFS